MREGTAEVPRQIAAAYLPKGAWVVDAATALDTTRDMVAPQPTLVELLVRHVLLPRELLPQIEINSIERSELSAGLGYTTRCAPYAESDTIVTHSGDHRVPFLYV